MSIPAFISGYSLRIAWKDLEPSKNVYDFSVIDATVSQLQTRNLKLTLEIFASDVPEYVIKEADDVIQVRRIQAPAPWDKAALASWNKFLTALANHPVYDAVSKKSIPLNKHPTLTAIDAPIVGLHSLRDIKEVQRNTLIIIEKNSYLP